MSSRVAVVDDRIRAYYDRRAVEYDEWWLGSGSFAGRCRLGWREEAAEIVMLAATLEPARTLDVACGTGFLTRHLRGEVVGIDQSAAMIAIARLAQEAPGRVVFISGGGAYGHAAVRELDLHDPHAASTRSHGCSERMTSARWCLPCEGRSA